jgi:hypothetical protein
MPGHKQSAVFKIYVLVVCTGWFAVLVAAIWGLDWRWIPTALLIAMVALLIGGLVENHLHERAQRAEFARQLDEAKGRPGWWLPRTDEEREVWRAQIAAEEEAWLGSKDQP